MFHLGEVKVRSKSSLDEVDGIVEKVDGKVEQRSRNDFTVNQDVRFVQMPSTGSMVRDVPIGRDAIPDDEDSWVFGKFVLLPVALKVDLASDVSFQGQARKKQLA